MTSDKKKKLRRILSALSPADKPDLLASELKEEIKAVESKIPKDNSPSISALRDAFVSLKNIVFSAVSTLPSKEDLNSLESNVLLWAAAVEKKVENIKIPDLAPLEVEIKDIKEELEKQEYAIERIPKYHGGGSANRQILQGSSVLSTRYTDINFLAGTNITLSKADDNTNKRVNFTINSTGGGGTPGGSNTEIQFNDSGVFGGDAALTFNKSSGDLRIGGDLTVVGPNGIFLSDDGKVSAGQRFAYGVGEEAVGLIGRTANKSVVFNSSDIGFSAIWDISAISSDQAFSLPDASGTIALTSDIPAAITALTGDGTASGPGSVALTLATINSNVGSFGSSTSIPSFTINGKGLITAASGNAVIAPAGTLTGATLPSNVLASSLTSVGTLTGGATGAGFTIALGTSTLTGDLPFVNLTQIAGFSILAKADTGTGDVAALTAGTDSVLMRSGSGNLTFGTIVTNQITADAVTYAKIQNVSGPNIMLGRITAGAGDIEELTAANVTTIINTSLDHNVLTNLIVGDVHTQYALLAGRSGGQTLKGGTASGNNLTLQSTSNATKGKIILGSGAYDEANKRFGLDTTSPSHGYQDTYGARASGENAMFVAPTLTNAIGLVFAPTIDQGTDGLSIISSQAVIRPTTALTTHYGMLFLPTIGGSSSNAITTVVDMFARTDTQASYAGNITTVANFQAAGVGHSGSGTVTNVYGFVGGINSAAGRYNLYMNGTADNYLNGNVQIGGTAARATTAGTNRLDIFNGTAPAGTLANGISLFSASGELKVADSGGTITLLSPHDDENYWVFDSEDTVTGQKLHIDVEKLLRFVNDYFGLDFIKGNMIRKT